MGIMDVLETLSGPEYDEPAPLPEETVPAPVEEVPEALPEEPGEDIPEELPAEEAVPAAPEEPIPATPVPLEDGYADLAALPPKPKKGIRPEVIMGIIAAFCAAKLD